MTAIATDERLMGDAVVRRAMAGDREAFTRLVATYDSSVAVAFGARVPRGPV